MDMFIAEYEKKFRVLSQSGLFMICDDATKKQSAWMGWVSMLQQASQKFTILSIRLCGRQLYSLR